MKTPFLVLCLFLFSTLTVAGQSTWVNNTSCSDDGAAIASEALEALINVERPTALGMARAALLIDNGCGLGKIVLANASGDSQERLLAEASEMNLSSDERQWLSLLQSDDPWRPAATAVVEGGNDAVLFAWMSSWDTNRGTVAENMEQFVANHPDHSGAAYNMLAYAYGQASWGIESVDMITAMRYLDLYEEAHSGPNPADSRSEILYSVGETSGAWDAIRTAVDLGGTPSIYATRAEAIWRAMNHDDLSEAISEQIKLFWSNSDDEAQLEARAALLNPVSTHCDSNMEACYSATSDEVLNSLSATAEWLSLEVDEIDVWFNDDYTTAVATHVNTGQYKAEGDLVDYKARASSVWNLDSASGDWLLVHGNFAPYGGSGIPSTK